MSENRVPSTFAPANWTFHSADSAINMYIILYYIASKKGLITVYDFMREYLYRNLELNIEDAVIPDWWTKWGWIFARFPMENYIIDDDLGHFYVNLPYPNKLK